MPTRDGPCLQMKPHQYSVPSMGFSSAVATAISRASWLSCWGSGGGVGGGSLPKSTCSVSGDPTANIDLSCDDPVSPDNETPIVTDPTNPNHLLTGSNDNFLTFKRSI